MELVRQIFLEDFYPKSVSSFSDHDDLEMGRREQQAIKTIPLGAKGKETQGRRRRQRTGESVSAGTTGGPPDSLFLHGEGADRQAEHSKTGVPTPGMELRELPRWKGGQS